MAIKRLCVGLLLLLLLTLALFAFLFINSATKTQNPADSYKGVFIINWIDYQQAEGV